MGVPFERAGVVLDSSYGGLVVAAPLQGYDAEGLLLGFLRLAALLHGDHVEQTVVEVLPVEAIRSALAVHTPLGERVIDAEQIIFAVEEAAIAAVLEGPILLPVKEGEPCIGPPYYAVENSVGDEVLEERQSASVPGREDA